MLNRRSFLTLGLGAAVAAKFAQLMPAPLESLILPPPAKTFVIPASSYVDSLRFPPAIEAEILRLLHERLRFGSAYSAPMGTAAELRFNHMRSVDLRIESDEWKLPLAELSERQFKPAVAVLADCINDDRNYRNAVMTFRGLHEYSPSHQRFLARFDVMRLSA